MCVSASSQPKRGLQRLNNQSTALPHPASVRARVQPLLSDSALNKHSFWLLTFMQGQSFSNSREGELS